MKKSISEIFDAEIKRLREIENIAREILTSLGEKTEIDPCGLDECHLITIIARIIDKNKARIK